MINSKLYTAEEKKINEIKILQDNLLKIDDKDRKRKINRAVVICESMSSDLT